MRNRGNYDDGGNKFRTVDRGRSIQTEEIKRRLEPKKLDPPIRVEATPVAREDQQVIRHEAGNGTTVVYVNNNNPYPYHPYHWWYSGYYFTDILAVFTFSVLFAYAIVLLLATIAIAGKGAGNAPTPPPQQQQQDPQPQQPRPFGQFAR